MIADIGEQRPSAGVVDDEPDIGVDADRPELRVLRSCEPVEGAAWRNGSICTSNAAAFCSYAVRRARLSGKVVAMRKFKANSLVNHQYVRVDIPESPFGLPLRQILTSNSPLKYAACSLS